MSNTSYRANYIILPEKNLIIEFHDGLIKAELLIAYKKQQATHEDFSPNRDFLVDLRLAEFTKRLDKVQEYVNFFYRTIKKLQEEEMWHLLQTVPIL